MMPLSIGDIVGAVGGRLVQGNPENTINGVSIDSRNIEKGNLFIPIVGERFDGHDFLDQAVDKGAGAILTAQDVSMPTSISVIRVRDTREALWKLAAYYRSLFDIPIISITGSNGKTTTKDMIYAVLSSKYKVLKTQGNFNNDIGMPLTIFNLDNSYQMAVLEMGMSGFGEIDRLARIARPKVGVITNIGLSHIEKLGSQENILKAKMEILNYFEDDCIAILNGDDRLLLSIKKEKLPFRLEYVGTTPNADIVAENIVIKGEEGIAYDMHMGDTSYNISLKVPGVHNVYNSLMAIATGLIFDVPMSLIQEALENFETGDMRLNVFNTQDGIKVIDDVYNASPASMKAAIDILHDFKGQRKIAILGDMLEMGEYAQGGHREVGKYLAEKGIDILITKGDLSEFIGRQAKDDGMSEQYIHHLKCNKDVINLLRTLVKEGDTILVKGSRGMKMEEIVQYFSKGRQ
ncbi:MAG: UDP-N-acetylmuramoyl-tripeptide--D-alanyl-D- alanine ligase [Xylanivirga thermophila]|jgi:UDP-N-acetylmuramoyl-tripeptide--D-alanyl-D-alanine ligase|uniref:UDP-N-acetylmuramoyl-tripeptide--D-alanyl-D- alanine ligase n=1 Tax=Xylanivirga thermophila TaxID=2496273 RepID=UPI00101B63ED|nr:UDP-N-acetylmuramoyl-tripeptide--D-alanyl-D-alanine ligase [Xylanivirga thermophila]